jgi:hypothetical protein
LLNQDSIYEDFVLDTSTLSTMQKNFENDLNTLQKLPLDSERLHDLWKNLVHIAYLSFSDMSNRKGIGLEMRWIFDRVKILSDLHFSVGHVNALMVIIHSKLDHDGWLKYLGGNFKEISTDSSVLFNFQECVLNILMILYQDHLNHDIAILNSLVVLGCSLFQSFLVSSNTLPPNTLAGILEYATISPVESALRFHVLLGIYLRGCLDSFVSNASLANFFTRSMQHFADKPYTLSYFKSFAPSPWNNFASSVEQEYKVCSWFPFEKALLAEGEISGQYFLSYYLGIMRNIVLGQPQLSSLHPIFGPLEYRIEANCVFALFGAMDSKCVDADLKSTEIVLDNLFKAQPMEQHIFWLIIKFCRNQLDVQQLTARKLLSLWPFQSNFNVFILALGLILQMSENVILDPSNLTQIVVDGINAQINGKILNPLFYYVVQELGGLQNSLKLQSIWNAILYVPFTSQGINAVRFLNSVKSVNLARNFIDQLCNEIKGGRIIKFFANQNQSLFQRDESNMVIVEALQNSIIIDLLLNFLERKDLEPEYVHSIVELVGGIVGYHPTTTEKFLNSGGFERIFDLLLTGNHAEYFSGVLFFKSHTNIYYITHAAALDQIFLNIQNLDSNAFKVLFNKVCSEINLWNLNKCREARLFRKLLSNFDLLADSDLLYPTIELMVNLLHFNADPEDLKHLFSFLRKGGSTGAPRLSWKHDILLEMLVNVTKKRIHCPSNGFFLLNSRNSRFEIPAILPMNLGLSSGFSVYITFCLSQCNPDDTIRIFEIAWDESDIELWVSISEAKLIYNLRKSDQISSTVICEEKLDLGLFHTLIFTCQIGMFGRTNEIFYINGKHIMQNSNSGFSPVGNLRMEIFKNPDLIFSPIFVGCFALFDIALAPEFINTIHFGIEVSLPVSTELYGFQHLSMSHLPILFCHPLGISEVDSSQCFNITRRSLFPNVKLVCIECVCVRSVPKALQSVGGFELLFPLLTHSTIAIEAPPKDHFHFVDHGKRTSLILELFQAILAASPFHRNMFIRRSGPKLVSLLLQKLPLELLSMEIFEAVIKFRIVRI